MYYGIFSGDWSPAAGMVIRDLPGTWTEDLEGEVLPRINAQMAPLGFNVIRLGQSPIMRYGLLYPSQQRSDYYGPYYPLHPYDEWFPLDSV